MANTKNNNKKSNTKKTPAKNSNAKKTTTAKTTTAKKAPAKTTTKKKTTTTAKKTPAKNTATKKTLVKKTSSKKSTSSVKKPTNVNKKSSTSSKKKSTPKKSSNIKVEFSDVEKIELPKLKDSTKKTFKNDNPAKKVIKTEEYTIINTSNKRNVKKSHATKVKNNKTNPILKQINKFKRKVRIYGITGIIPKQYLVGSILILLAIVIIILFNIFLGGNNVSLDISLIPEKIDALKTVSFNMDDVDNIITSSKAYPTTNKGTVDLKDYYEYDFQNIFELDPSFVSEYIIKYNEAKKYFFIVILPSNNNHDNVVDTFDKFIKKIGVSSYENFEYQDYIIYINSASSEGNKIVKSKIMQSQIRVFDLLQDLKKDDIEATLNIPSNYYSEAIVKTPMVVKSDVCGYAIFKPTSVYNKTKIISLMNEYYDTLLEKWNNNSENKKLLENRSYEEYQGYIIFVVSHDNKLVLDFIKSN